MDEYEEAVLFTFALLESRLDRLEYVLNGARRPADTEEKPKSVTERIQRIERLLQELSIKSTLITEAQLLCMHWTFQKKHIWRLTRDSEQAQRCSKARGSK